MVLNHAKSVKGLCRPIEIRAGRTCLQHRVLPGKRNTLALCVCLSCVFIFLKHLVLNLLLMATLSV